MVIFPVAQRHSNSVGGSWVNGGGGSTSAANSARLPNIRKNIPVKKRMEKATRILPAERKNWLVMGCAISRNGWVHGPVWPLYPSPSAERGEKPSLGAPARMHFLQLLAFHFGRQIVLMEEGKGPRQKMDVVHFIW